MESSENVSEMDNRISASATTTTKTTPSVESTVELENRENPVSNNLTELLITEIMHKENQQQQQLQQQVNSTSDQETMEQETITSAADENNQPLAEAKFEPEFNLSENAENRQPIELRFVDSNYFKQKLYGFKLLKNIFQ